MRTTVVVIGGFLAGVALFERGPGIELSTLVLTAVCAVVAPVVDG